MNDYGFVLSVLGIFDKYDDEDGCFWRVQRDGSIRFLVNCNDLFYWATSDAEEVGPEDLEDLEKAYADCTAAGQTWYGGLLYAARKRGMRPQAPYFKYFREDALVELFKAAGPEREDTGNIDDYLARRSNLSSDPDMVAVEQERANARRYLKRVTAERELTDEDRRMIEELLSLDHGDG